MIEAKRRFMKSCAALFVAASGLIVGASAEASNSKWAVYSDLNRTILLNGRDDNPDKQFTDYSAKAGRYFQWARIGFSKGEAVQITIASNDFQPKVYVFDYDGKRQFAVSTPINGTAKHTARLFWEVKSGDEYLIVYSSADPGGVGKYAVNVKRMNPAKPDTNRVKPPKPDLTAEWWSDHNWVNFKGGWYGNSQEEGRTIHPEPLVYEYVEKLEGYRWVCKGNWGLIQNRTDVSRGRFKFIFELNGERFDGSWWYHEATYSSAWDGKRVYN